MFRLVHKHMITTLRIGKTLRRELNAARAYVGDGEVVPAVLHEMDNRYVHVAASLQCVRSSATPYTLFEKCSFRASLRG